MSVRFVITPLFTSNGNRLILQKNIGCVSKQNLNLIRFKHEVTSRNISKNLQMITTTDVIKNEKGICNENIKPMAVIFPWLLARKKHVSKYYDVYLSRGFDVLSVTITPWQFFWPLTGSQVVATELVNYLHDASRQTLVVHGFSVGAYLWGECLVKFNSDLSKYSNVMSTIKGQIFDSAADITEASKGLPQAMFPRNAFLRSTIEKYVEYHLRTFYDTATQHYLRASQFYHTSPVRSPCLVYLSKNDPIGSVLANTRARESWESLGMKVFWKCWDKSRHVSHMMHHKEEYISSLVSFLEYLENADEQSVRKHMTAIS